MEIRFLSVKKSLIHFLRTENISSHQGQVYQKIFFLTTISINAALNIELPDNYEFLKGTITLFI